MNNSVISNDTSNHLLNAQMSGGIGHGSRASDVLPPVTPPVQQDRMLLQKAHHNNNGMSSRKDIASAMAAGFSQGERSFVGDDPGLARL
jgi:hypothetical protein